jgi:hypothetical protein
MASPNQVIVSYGTTRSLTLPVEVAGTARSAAWPAASFRASLRDPTCTLLGATNQAPGQPDYERRHNESH